MNTSAQVIHDFNLQMQHNAELIRLQSDTIKAQQVEIETLKGLLPTQDFYCPDCGETSPLDTIYTLQPTPNPMNITCPNCGTNFDIMVSFYETRQ